MPLQPEPVRGQRCVREPTRGCACPAQARVSSYHFLRRGRSTFTNAFRLFPSHARFWASDKGASFLMAIGQPRSLSLRDVLLGKLSNRYRLSRLTKGRIASKFSSLVPETKTSIKSLSRSEAAFIKIQGKGVRRTRLLGILQYGGSCSGSPNFIFRSGSHHFLRCPLPSIGPVPLS
jgi:hypothetical protein